MSADPGPGATVPGARTATAFGLAGALGTVLWAGSAIVMAGRGFGGPTEGYYVLSYVGWDTTPRTLSMAQYYYGPVFDLLGQDLALLRVFRVFTILVAHLVFGLQFSGWLARARGGFDEGKAWRASIVLLITACGGISYGWLPATPGYNDVAVLGTLCLLASYFAILRRESADVGLGAAFGFGAVAVLMVLAKATTAASVTAIAVAILVACGGRAASVKFLGVALAGGVVVLLGLHVLVKPLGESVPPMVDMLRYASSIGHRPTELASLYLTSTLEAVALGVIAFGLPGILVLVVLRRRVNTAARIAPVIAVGVNLGLIGIAGGLMGGLSHVGAYQAGIVAMVLVAAFAAGFTSAHWLPSIVLAASPFLAAVGTNNPLPAVAAGGAAAWIALALLLVSRSSRPMWSRQLATTATVGAVFICTSVGVTASMHTPDGDDLVGVSMMSVNGVAPLSSIEVPSSQADMVHGVRERLAAYIEPAGRAMVAYGALADAVVLLNGRPVGNAWFTFFDEGLQTADLKSACAGGHPWGRRLPLVLADRTLTDDEHAGLSACDLDLSRDYRRVDLADLGADYWVYVPRTGP